MAARKISAEIIFALTETWKSGSASASDIATLVRGLLQQFALQYPGKTVELRVPPYGAVQCIPGASHTRGTPPNVVEMSVETFLNLAFGNRSWEQLQQDGKISASGVHANLEKFFPIAQ